MRALQFSSIPCCRLDPPPLLDSRVTGLNVCSLKGTRVTALPTGQRCFDELRSTLGGRPPVPTSRFCLFLLQRVRGLDSLSVIDVP